MEGKKRFSSITSTLKFISGIVSWIVLVILLLIAAFFIYYYISVKIYEQKGDKYKPLFSLYTILSPSMVPNINVYDVIIDTSVNSPEDIKVGDVITFISTANLTKGMTITHRVTQVKNENGKYSYVTKGDANLSPDGRAAEYENVLGKVLFKVPALGRVQSFLSTKSGWLLVVVLPALFIIVSDILKIFRLTDVKKNVKNREQIENAKLLKEDKKKQSIKDGLVEHYKKKRKDNDKPPIKERILINVNVEKKNDKIIIPKLSEKDNNNLPILNNSRKLNNRERKLKKKNKNKNNN